MATEFDQKRFPRKHKEEPSMTPRERVIRAVRRTGPDRVPTCARFTPPMMRFFNEKVDAGIPERHLGQFGIPSGFIHEVRPTFLTPDAYFDWDVRHVSFKAPRTTGDFSSYHSDLPPDTKVNEWGLALIPGPFLHYTKTIAPLKSLSTFDELRVFPFPDPMAPECHEELDQGVACIHEDGYAAAGFLQQTLFELAWEMRGMDTLLLDF